MEACETERGFEVKQLREDWPTEHEWEAATIDERNQWLRLVIAGPLQLPQRMIQTKSP
jgi:hypothetical protein